MKTSLQSNFQRNMFCQLNAPERATTDDVTLCWQTDICIKTSVSFTQNSVNL